MKRAHPRRPRAPRRAPRAIAGQSETRGRLQVVVQQLRGAAAARRARARPLQRARQLVELRCAPRRAPAGRPRAYTCRRRQLAARAAARAAPAAGPAPAGRAGARRRRAASQRPGDTCAGTSAPSCAASSSSSRSSPSPDACAASRSAAAASAEPPPSPAATGMRLCDRQAQRRRIPAGARAEGAQSAPRRGSRSARPGTPGQTISSSPPAGAGSSVSSSASEIDCITVDQLVACRRSRAAARGTGRG